MKKHILLITIVLLLTACAPSQVAVQGSPVDTQAAILASTPTATAIPTATSSPTATSNPCTDLGWKDIINYLNEFNFQAGIGTQQGVIVSEWLKTVTGIKENIANVTVDACAEHARELVVSSLDNRITAQHMMYTGQFNDPNALTDKLLQGNKMMDDARAELKGLGLQVTLP
jgi:hypothetical protein